jgi:hypothetical protein
LIIIEQTPIEPYKQLAFAVGMVETKCDTLAYNPLEEAVGVFQIRPIKLVEYNKRTGSNYRREDLFNYKTSEKIFLYFADQIGPYNLELIAKKWNGSGHMTINYWQDKTIPLKSVAILNLFNIHLYYFVFITEERCTDRNALIFV